MIGYPYFRKPPYIEIYWKLFSDNVKVEQCSSSLFCEHQHVGDPKPTYHHHVQPCDFFFKIGIKCPCQNKTRKEQCSKAASGWSWSFQVMLPVATLYIFKRIIWPWIFTWNLVKKTKRCIPWNDSSGFEHCSVVSWVFKPYSLYMGVS